MELPNNNRTDLDALPVCVTATVVRFTALAALFLPFLLMPRLASAQMSIQISVYSQITESADDNTMYGSTSASDNSTLGGQCGHSGYVTTSQLIDPNGVTTSTSTGSFSADVSAPVNGLGGSWQVLGIFQFHCSCAGNIRIGDEEQTQACVAHLTQPRNLPRSPAAASGPRPRPVAASLVGEAPAIISVSTVLKASVRATRPQVPPPAALQRTDASRPQ